MKIELIALGKTSEKYLKTGIEKYTTRLSHYKPRLDYTEIPIPSKLYSGSNHKRAMETEADLVLRKITDSDHLTLLDDKGKMYSSVEFAARFEKMLLSSHRKWILLIGGPYGFAPELKERADSLLSLSRMTFSHQMVRLITLEQLYRAQTIINKQSYHHE